MTEQRRIFRPPTRSKPFDLVVFASSLALATALSPVSPAVAQSGAVTVDLSVIQDGGNSGFGPSSGGGLLVPPRTNPGSELHVAPQRAPKLVAPMAKAQPATRPALDAPQKPPAEPKRAEVAPAPPAVLAAPAPKPAPVETVAKAEMTPAPAPAATPEPEKKPAPVPAAPAAATPSASDAPPPPPQVAKAPDPAASAEQASAGSQAIEIAPGQALRIEFSEAETKLPDAMKDALRKVADGVHDKQDLRLQLMAYAGAEGLSASKARRLSLSRALSVRSFLIESGVRSTRIDVRALGNKTSEKPANRVDVNIAKR